MKTAVITCAVAAFALLGFAPEAEAGPRFSFSFGNLPQPPFGGHVVTPRVPFHSPSSHSYRGYSNSFRGGHCATPYVVHTYEISRRRQCITSYDHYGRAYQSHVTVVTYRDQYSNGTYRTYTRTYR